MTPEENTYYGCIEDVLDLLDDVRYGTIDSCCLAAISEIERRVKKLEVKPSKQESNIPERGSPKLVRFVQCETCWQILRQEMFDTKGEPENFVHCPQCNEFTEVIEIVS
jgi:hypothetical protein